MRYTLLAPVLAICWLSGCGKSDAGTPPAKDEAAAAMLKLSKFGHAEYCDVVYSPDGHLHAVFTDSPDPSRPTYVYYRASADAGSTWSDSKNLSDDESGKPAAYVRLLADAKGRLYAIWKYNFGSTLIDGPGGNEPGIIVYRCLENGTWSKTTAFNKEKAWAFSFFAGLDSKGAVNVVMNQIAPDAAASGYATQSANMADLVQQVTLDGATSRIKGLIVPEPLKSEAQYKAQGIAATYEMLAPKQEGMINLRGYFDASGAAHFLGERLTPQSLQMFDGKKLSTVYTYIPYASGNTFSNPPTLLVDAQGVDHVIRKPEKSESPCIRDYLVGQKLSDPTDIVAINDPSKGDIFNWQAVQGPNGTMAVLYSLSQTAKLRAEDVEKYVTFSRGKGEWSKPITLTDNAHHNSFKAAHGAAVSTTYDPRFTSLAFGSGDHVVAVMINNAYTLGGVDTVGVTNSGRAVTGFASFGGIDSPEAYFVKVR